jgi:tetratricopeptide (TPR) repeat protein
VVKLSKKSWLPFFSARTVRRMALGCTMAAALGGPIGILEPPPVAAAAEQVDAAELVDRMLQSTAYVLADNSPQPAWTGSGWVIDKGRRLMITNQHVVSNLDQVYVIFPEYHEEDVVRDTDHYLRQSSRIAAKVILSDPARDLAVIQLESLPEGIEALPLASRSPRAGERLHSLGNPEGEMWLYTEGRVRGVRVKTFYNDDGNLGTIRRHCKVVETQSPTNHGDSGGPVVNDRGEIVGVVQGGKLNANLLHYFIDVSEVRAFIKQVDELWSPTSARAYVARAKLLLDNQRLDRALADATAAVKADRKLSEAFQVRGDVFRARGDLESAVADYSQALELDATSVAAYLGRGQAYCRQRRLDEAVADFTTALRLDPMVVDPYRMRGMARRLKGEFALALDDLNAALNLEPMNADCLTQRGRVYLAKGDANSALTDFVAAFNGDPTAGEAAAGAGYAMALLKVDSSQIIDALNAGIGARPQEPQTHFLAGLALVELGDYSQAVTQFTRAIELDGKQAEFYICRGSALDKLGDAAGARADYDQAIQLDPVLAQVVASLGSGGSAVPPLPGGAGAIPGGQQATQFYTRHILVSNNTDRPIRVYLQYFTYDANGQWGWYGDTSEETYWAIQPGVRTYLAMNDVKLHAQRVRIWARSEDGSLQWLQYRDQDLELVPSEGYSASELGDYEIPFSADNAGSGSGTAGTQAGSGSNESLTRFYTRFLRVRNETGTTIRIHMRYYSFDSQGQWNWYGDGYTWDVGAGQEGTLAIDNVPIHAQKVVLWGEALDGSITFKETEVELAPTEGYLASEREVTTVPFRSN